MDPKSQALKSRDLTSKYACSFLSAHKHPKGAKALKKSNSAAPVILVSVLGDLSVLFSCTLVNVCSANTPDQGEFWGGIQGRITYNVGTYILFYDCPPAHLTFLPTMHMQRWWNFYIRRRHLTAERPFYNYPRLYSNNTKTLQDKHKHDRKQ